MKFFRKIKKDEQEQDIPQIEAKEQDIDFTDSMFSDIAEMKLGLENIKSEQEICEELKLLIESFEKYIEKSSEIIEERKIEEKLKRINESNIILKLETSPQIPQSLQDRANQELTIDEYYKNIKAVYETKYNRATQSILMKKVEKFNDYMDKLLFGQVDFDTIKIDDIREIQTYYGILKQKNEEFTGIMQNKYVEKLIELQYKINMIDIITMKIVHDNNLNDSARINELIKESQATKSKQAIWSRLFINGVENLIGRANNKYTRKLQSDLSKINLKDNKEEILDADVIDTYVKGIVQIQRDKIADEQRQQIEETKEKERLKKEEEEQKKQEELDKIARISESEIQEKIKELDDDKFDIVTSYKSIIDYQIKIAKAKGLIDDRNILAINDITITRVERGMIPLVFANLKDQIFNCEIYTDVDDSKKNVYITTPKGKAIILKKASGKYNDWKNTDGMGSMEITNTFFTIYTKSVRSTNIEAKIDNKIYFYNENAVIEDIKGLVNQYKEENDENSKKVKFYIEVPYRRTIIPILEQLQQNGIEFTIPPTDKETKMNEPTVKIYMDRSDLERYKESVHKNISTIDKGIVKIGEEEIHIDEILVEGCKFPFLQDKQKEQKQPE